MALHPRRITAFATLSRAFYRLVAIGFYYLGISDTKPSN